MYSPAAVCFLAPTESSLETGCGWVLLPFVTVTLLPLQVQYSGFLRVCQSVFSKYCRKRAVCYLIKRRMPVRHAHEIGACCIDLPVFHINLGQILHEVLLVAAGKQRDARFFLRRSPAF